MEDYALDLVIGEGPSARSVRIDLSPFTLVGATTRSGPVSYTHLDVYKRQIFIQSHDYWH